MVPLRSGTTAGQPRRQPGPGTQPEGLRRVRLAAVTSSTLGLSGVRKCSWQRARASPTYRSPPLHPPEVLPRPPSLRSGDLANVKPLPNLRGRYRLAVVAQVSSGTREGWGPVGT